MSSEKSSSSELERREQTLCSASRARYLSSASNSHREIASATSGTSLHDRSTHTFYTSIMRLFLGIHTLIILGSCRFTTACEGECIVGITKAFLGNYTSPISETFRSIVRVLLSPAGNYLIINFRLTNWQNSCRLRIVLLTR